MKANNCQTKDPDHISSLTCFSRHNFRTQHFYRNRYFKNKASVALNPLVSLFGRLVACSGRKRGNNRRTEWQTKYYNPRCACVPRVKNRWNTFGTSHRCLDCILTTLQIHETNYIYTCMYEWRRWQRAFLNVCCACYVGSLYRNFYQWVGRMYVNTRTTHTYLSTILTLQQHPTQSNKTVKTYEKKPTYGGHLTQWIAQHGMG